MCSKSRSRVPTRARRPEDYGSQSAERGAVLGEASLGPLSSPESPSLDRTLVLCMARVVQTVPEVVLGKSCHLCCRLGCCLRDESRRLIPGELPEPSSLSTVAVLWTVL